jgi:hypothetical protein
VSGLRVRSRAIPRVALGRWLVTALAALALMGPGRTIACDVCAIYSGTEHREARTGWRLGVAEQYTRFATRKDDGEEVDNPGERLHSSITQLLFGYNATPWLGAQLNLPLISRHFRRLEDGVLTRGDETGPGDLSLIGVLRPFSLATEESVFRVALIGGLKLPSGSADRLREELAEDHHTGGEDVDDHGTETARVARDRHAQHEAGGESGVHGHDLALGSGSVDGVIGGQLFGSWRRFFLSAGVQYAIRTEGSIDYRFANDLTWTGGPGIFAIASPEYTLALQAVVAGEHKGKDTLDGEAQADTAITAIYLGPGFTFTWGDALGADLTVDLPVLQDNSALQLVADWRLRGGVTWHF